jgi:origin recognition complex subunit 2
MSDSNHQDEIDGGEVIEGEVQEIEMQGVEHTQSEAPNNEQTTAQHEIDGQDERKNDGDDGGKSDDRDDEQEEESLSKEEKMEREDELISFILRGRLSLIKFSLIWSVIVREKLNWKFHESCYIAPNGENLGGAKEAMEMLDSYSLQSLCKPMSRTPADTQGQEKEKLYKKWRRELLTAIFDKCKREKKTLPCFYFDVEDEDESDGDRESREISDEDISSYARFSDLIDNDTNSKMANANTGSERAAKYVAMTENEAGTDQYFQNKTTRPSRRNKEKNKTVPKPSDTRVGGAKTDTDTSSKKKKLKFPHPQECVFEKCKESEKLHSKWRKEFLRRKWEEWRFLLGTDHSLIFYGFGSKQTLLADFAEKLRPFGDVLILNGFDKDISVAEILDIFVQLFLKGIEPPNSDHAGKPLMNDGMVYASKLMKRAKAIGQALKSRHVSPIYLVIHNIDGIALRDEDSQTALATLLVNSKTDIVDNPEEGYNERRVVRLISSIDHVDAEINLWNLKTQDNFAWIWKHADTYVPYYDEIQQISTGETRQMKVKQKQVLDYEFMQKVLKSLAPRHAQTLKMLAQMQISQGKVNKRAEGYEYVNKKDFDRKRKDEMITKTDAQMQSILNELCDHGMIRWTTDYTTQQESLCIPTSKEKVQEILHSL